MYRDIEEESPTDRDSEDSVEVRVKPIKKTIAMAPSTPTSAKKNKRKSMEPKRLSAAATETVPGSNPEVTIKRCRLNSTGSEDHSSPPVSYNSESRSPSPVSPDSKSDTSSSSPASKRASLSPMCLAPKKRFKFDALRDLEQLNSDKTDIDRSAMDLKTEDKDPTEKSPFRPWSGSQAAAPASEAKPPVHRNGAGVGGVGGLVAGGQVPNLPYIPAFLLPGLMAGAGTAQDGNKQLAAAAAEEAKGFALTVKESFVDSILTICE